MASEIMRNWPDLSHYNLRMLTVKIPDGSWRLMMLNGDMYPSRMQDLGFKKTNGIWIKSDASVAFSKLSAAFPAVKVISVPEKSIQKTVSVKKDYVPVSSNVPEDQDIEQSEQEKQELDFSFLDI